ncbi:MAG: ABC transporter substrate-binding protein, partial [Ilumatobacteraceae bacterium]
TVLVTIALGAAVAACADDESAPTASAPLVATSDAATAGPAPSTAPLTVVPTTEAGAAPTTEADAPPTTPAPAVFPRTVEHAMGTTEIPAAPQRVVTLDMSFVDAALALDSPIVGYTRYQDPDGSLPAYFGDALTTLAADATYMGDLLEPNIEAIAAAQPDLILTSKVRHEAIYDQLSAIAPTIMSESAGAGWKDNIRLTASVLGKEATAEEVIVAYETRAAAVGAAVNEAADNPTISVVRFAALDKFRLYQRASFSGVVLDDAGLARPANQQSTEPATFITEVSFEELAEADAGADVLFYTIFGNEDPADEQANGGRSAIEANPLWAALPTVQADTAHEMSDETWMSAVGMYGAQAILDDLAATFGVDPARDGA